MKRKKRNNFAIALLVALAVLLVTTLVLAGMLVVMLFRYNEVKDVMAGEDGQPVSDLAQQSGSQLEDMQGILDQISSLDGDKSQLEEQLKAAKTELESLMNSFSDYDSRCNALNSQVTQLNEAIRVKDNEIARLEKTLDEMQNVFMVDMNAQYTILNELESLLANPPSIKKEVETVNSAGETVVEIQEVQPKLALYYEDISSGNQYAFQADQNFDSASLVKAPYMLSLLQAASEEADELEAKRVKALMENSDPAFVYEEPVRVYDFSRTITYTEEEYYQPGSGDIINGGEGKEYSHQDLIYHVLECSDNVGYSVIRKEYGNELMKGLIKRLGLKSMASSTSLMSARDAGKIMKEVYAFVSGDAYYASFMKNAMVSSRHTVLTAYAASPKKVAHKYGWDLGAYHDMAVVFDDHPYVVAVLSDYDEGGKEVDAYLCSLLDLIDRLHENFYKLK